MRAILLSIVVVQLTFAALTAPAQQPTCQTTLPVSALDRKTGQPIDGLTASDLLAKFEGKELPIRSLSPSPVNRRIVFVLDRSGSMTEVGTPWQHYDPSQLMKQALEEALSEIPQGDKIAFLAFAGRSSTRSEFMQARSARAKLSDMLAWKPSSRGGGHRTPLWDNIEAALRMLSPHEVGDAIVVATDGGENLSEMRRVQVQKELLEDYTPLLAILLTEPDAPTPLGEADPKNLIAVTGETGGMVAPLGTTRRSLNLIIDLPLSPSQLVAQFAHQYELEVELSPIQRTEKWSLVPRSRDAEKKLKLIYPRYLSTCAATR